LACLLCVVGGSVRLLTNMSHCFVSYVLFGSLDVSGPLEPNVRLAFLLCVGGVEACAFVGCCLYRGRCCAKHV